MKKILFIIPASILFNNCSVFKSGQRTATSAQPNTTSAQRLNLLDNSAPAADLTSTDTVVVIGTQYIPIEGRSETGTRADLEGAWVLDSLNGTAIPGTSGLNIEPPTKIPEGTEVRHDSTTTTKTVNGVTHTTTSVLIDKSGTAGNKITPPQGSNFHIPAKPSISFYGANETFSGFTGCNRFSGRYIVSGRDTINLQTASASTKMVCLGDYDETAFLNTLRRVNSFKAANGHLSLLEGDKVLLVFYKKQL